jgi:hypothetical protein
MKERPILFSAPMVRAILERRKTQTRRIMKPQPYGFLFQKPVKSLGGAEIKCPYGQTGDRLWVRETWGTDAPNLDTCRRGVESDGLFYGPYYAADADWFDNHTVRMRPSIHMPRWASRITLEITNVRVERLQDISREDAIAEGTPPPDAAYSMRDSYMMLWESINGRGSWATNPWVWVIEFKRFERETIAA